MLSRNKNKKKGGMIKITRCAGKRASGTDEKKKVRENIRAGEVLRVILGKRTEIPG